ncbi:MAG TPA: anthranilate phosphoribosyltransferase [Bacteroidetes bacterium]|nr:anthranilate phosphoribosyltransferase [Bacteroidota bacterium]
MKEILEHLYRHKTLTREEARTVLVNMAGGRYNHYQVTSFLTAFIMRNITLEELKGFREALLELCVPVDLGTHDIIDLCGTGGDGKNTFNISTLASFVVAGAGIPVAKHGNYGVSSVSGSSNVLEFLGIRFSNNESGLKKELEKAGICFMHAPLFHPAMKEVAPVRKQLGVKTFFNMLGPLVNPARPAMQMTGVFGLELARLYHYLFQETGMKYSIVYSLDGYDEISLTGEFKMITGYEEMIAGPDYFGFDHLPARAIHGGNSIEESAAIFTRVLDGEGTESQNRVVLANAAAAIRTFYPELKPERCMEKARESLFALKARESFNRLRSLS